MFTPGPLLVEGQGVVVEFAYPLAFWSWGTHAAGAAVTQGFNFAGADRLHAAEPAVATARLTGR